jgi:hypothetical protein
MTTAALAPHGAAASSNGAAASPKADATLTTTVSPSPTLTLEYQRPKSGKTVTLTAKAGDAVLHVESLDLTRSRSRTRFADAVCQGRPGIDRSRVDAELLRIAAELAHDNGSGDDDGGNGDKHADADDLPELDAGRIVRPERFIATDVSGLAVPSIIAVGERPVGQWRLYMKWRDGRRQAVRLPWSLDLPAGDGQSTGRRLWIHPTPADPSARQTSGWSQAARRRWLSGGGLPDPAALFAAVCERFAHFLHLPAAKAPGTTATLALWVLLSYVYPAFDAVPYLFLGGPLGSGKSRVFEILARLTFRPLSSSNLSAAALFRTLHDRGGCLLLDEAERLKQTAAPDVSELLSLLLAGYKRGGQATRLEPVGDTFRTVAFDVFGPKALACIAGLPPALASRAIPVMMFRSPPGSDKPRRRIDAEPERWQSLRDDLHALALDHGPTWLELPKRAGVCPAMSGRDYELWQPLLSLADWIESHGAAGLLELVQQHALASIDEGCDDAAPDHDETLLRLLADAVRTGDAPTAAELLDAAQKQDARTFDKWTARAVAGHLKRYGLTTNKTAGRKVYGRVSPADLRAIQATYHLDLGFDDEPAGADA